MSDQESSRSYQGWKNYETWAVGLYLDGNYAGEGTYREVLELARMAQGAYALADALEELVTDGMPDLGASLEADLLNAALSEVDWHELAEAKLAEIGEQDD